MSIKFTFHKGGFVTVTPTGYQGSTCHDATRPYTDKFGGKQTTEETTEETATHVVNLNQQQKAGQ